ncbi:hypothetical protein EMPS_07698 [Entomortierella parvispora]|uniref:Uncharacterized protein n=1 Tax=Entomortierella parvispora TaxID=205924 RepID=A0A9P3LYX7_9FUNG|nr:hypothetical protein EMPS_07698 [Entomortierella parvispora]
MTDSAPAQVQTQTLPDNQLILQRAADSCRALDDLRMKLHKIQGQLAAHRMSTAPGAAQGSEAIIQEGAWTALLQEAYLLQFQISTLLSATEEPIPERQRITKSASAERT